MKNLIRSTLQKIFGFKNYLFLFSIISIRSLKIKKDDKEFLYFIEIAPDQGTILDIGANIGLTSIPLAQAKSKATVFAFEPMPENIHALKRIIKYYKLKNVRVFETALGDKPGELKMVMPIVKNAKMQGLSHIISDDEAKNYHPSDITKVPVNTLDTIKELSTAEKITAIKIDVENFEYYVLKGGREMLLKHKPLIYCELWGNEKRQLTIDYLKGLGYDVKFFDGTTLVPYTDQETINFFFVPA